jgi:hypothetical protein
VGPVFGDEVERISSDAWRVKKNGSTFPIKVVLGSSSRTVNYRKVSPGGRTDAFIRVLARPKRGSVVVMTLPVPTGEDGQRVASVLATELRIRSLIDQSKTREAN